MTPRAIYTTCALLAAMSPAERRQVIRAAMPDQRGAVDLRGKLPPSSAPDAARLARPAEFLSGPTVGVQRATAETFSAQSGQAATAGGETPASIPERRPCS